MTLYRFTVGYEGTIEAPDPDTARAWALEEVEHGHFAVSVVEAEPDPLVQAQRRRLALTRSAARKDTPE